MRCPGCRGLLLQGKEGAIHFPSYSLLEKAPAARSQPTAANRCCRSRRVARHPSEIFGSFWEMVNPSPWDSPYLLARRGGREAARGSERGCPPLSSSYCCFGNWGKKKRKLIWGIEGRALRDRLRHVRVHRYVMSCARGHDCRHPIDYGSPTAGKICPRFNAARDGPTGLFLTMNCLVKVPLLVLAGWGGQRQAAPWATGRGQE